MESKIIKGLAVMVLGWAMVMGTFAWGYDSGIDAATRNFTVMPDAMDTLLRCILQNERIGDMLRMLDAKTTADLQWLADN